MMKSAKKAIIFDLDGVVVDTEPLYTNAEIRLFTEYNVTIPKEDWQIFRGCSEQNFFDLSMKRYGITEKKDVFIDKGRKYVREEFKNNLSYMSGFHDLYKRISPFYKIGLVTATPHHSLKWIRKHIRLDNYFKNILSGDDTKRNKPFPDPYLAMMKTLNVVPNNTLIIEDSIPGLQSAIASGSNVIALTGSAPRKDLSIANKIVSHLDEITIQMIEDLL